MTRLTSKFSDTALLPVGVCAHVNPTKRQDGGRVGKDSPCGGCPGTYFPKPICPLFYPELYFITLKKATEDSTASCLNCLSAYYIKIFSLNYNSSSPSSRKNTYSIVEFLTKIIGNIYWYCIHTYHRYWYYREILEQNLVIQCGY